MPDWVLGKDTFVFNFEFIDDCVSLYERDGHISLVNK